jgi:hypothetical protein
VDLFFDCDHQIDEGERIYAFAAEQTDIRIPLQRFAVGA